MQQRPVTSRSGWLEGKGPVFGGRRVCGGNNLLKGCYCMGSWQFELRRLWRSGRSHSLLTARGRDEEAGLGCVRTSIVSTIVSNSAAEGVARPNWHRSMIAYPLPLEAKQLQLLQGLRMLWLFRDSRQRDERSRLARARTLERRSLPPASSAAPELFFLPLCLV